MKKCHICGNVVRHAYARWTVGIVCSAECNEKQITQFKEKSHGKKPEATRVASKHEFFQVEYDSEGQY